MRAIADNRGYNQCFAPTRALEVRTLRRCLKIVAEMDLTQTGEILELGCGTGAMSSLLALNTGRHVVGADICEKFIEEARKNHDTPNLSFKVLDITGYDLVQQLGRQYSYIVGNGILHHLYDELDAVLPKLQELLAPGGKLVFWEPNLYNPIVFLLFRTKLLRRAARLEPQEMAFTGEWIAAKLARAGFGPVRVEYRDFLFPNTPYAFIQLLVKIGDMLERVPLLNRFAQSLFISAKNGN